MPEGVSKAFQTMPNEVSIKPFTNARRGDQSLFDYARQDAQFLLGYDSRGEQSLLNYCISSEQTFQTMIENVIKDF